MEATRIWILLGKKLSGEASAAELEELDALLSQGLGDVYPIHILEKIWRENPVHPPLYFNKALNDKWLRFEERLKALDETGEQVLPQATVKKGRVKALSYWVGGIAASLLIGIGFFWATETRKTDTDNRITQIVAPKGGISKVQLPDGTHVWLNSGSKLTYENHFGEQLRKVTLVGEAFFDVVKDPLHPFIVTTGSFQLKVLGTAFNVRSYPSDKTSEAALVRGKIQIQLLKNPDKEITLLPTEKLIIKNTEQAAVKNKNLSRTHSAGSNDIPLIALSATHQSVNDTLPSEALWMENKLAFDAESFEEIAGKMERWFSVKIEFKNENVKGLRFTGEFKNESLYQTLASLQLIAPFHFSIKDNNKVIIY